MGDEAMFYQLGDTRHNADIRSQATAKWKIHPAVPRVKWQPWSAEAGRAPWAFATLLNCFASPLPSCVFQHTMQPSYERGALGAFKWTVSNRAALNPTGKSAASSTHPDPGGKPISLESSKQMISHTRFTLFRFLHLYPAFPPRIQRQLSFLSPSFVLSSQQSS